MYVQVLSYGGRYLLGQNYGTLGMIHLGSQGGWVGTVGLLELPLNQPLIHVTHRAPICQTAEFRVEED